MGKCTCMGCGKAPFDVSDYSTTYCGSCVTGRGALLPPSCWCGSHEHNVLKDTEGLAQLSKMTVLRVLAAVVELH